jgi:hypothetical protein
LRYQIIVHGIICNALAAVRHQSTPICRALIGSIGDSLFQLIQWPPETS